MCFHVARMRLRYGGAFSQEKRSILQSLNTKNITQQYYHKENILERYIFSLQTLASVYNPYSIIFILQDVEIVKSVLITQTDAFFALYFIKSLLN